MGIRIQIPGSVCSQGVMDDSTDVTMGKRSKIHSIESPPHASDMPHVAPFETPRRANHKGSPIQHTAQRSGPGRGDARKRIHHEERFPVDVPDDGCLPRPCRADQQDISVRGEIGFDLVEFGRPSNEA